MIAIVFVSGILAGVFLTLGVQAYLIRRVFLRIKRKAAEEAAVERAIASAEQMQALAEIERARSEVLRAAAELDRLRGREATN